MKLFRIAAVVLLCAAASPALGFGSSAPADPDKAWADGTAALKAGDYKAAEKQFKIVVDASPGNAEASYYLGVAKAGRGDHKGALKVLETAIAADVWPAYEQAGRSYMALGKKDKAQALLEALAAKASACGDSCPAGIAAARTALTAVIDGTAPAAPAPQSLLFAPQGEPHAAYLGAVALINQGRYEDAIASLKALGADIGPNADVLNYLGYASRKLGRFDEAQAYYGKALARDPNHRGAREYLGELFVELRRMDEARAQLAALDRLCPYGCTEREMLAERIDAVVIGAR